MKIYECLLYGLIDEEIVSNDLVTYIERKVRDKQGFLIKSVKEGSNPSHITKGIIGFYPPYGISYISNPEKDSGLTGIDILNKRLIHCSFNSPFFNQRDSVVYVNPIQTYIRYGHKEVIKEFKENEYRLFDFNPKYKGDSLIRHKSFERDIIGREIDSIN